MEPVTLHINGEDTTVSIEKNQTLLSVLRDTLHMTGTKCGCNTSDCGACKVIIDGDAVNSCVILARNCAGKSIETIEGLSHGTDLHPIQQAFVESGAIQCGYCTPGMIMSAKALLDKNPNPDEQDVRAAIENNLCRCTGYVKIVDAILLAAKRMRQDEAAGHSE
jgi:carbon-monoxide dehydrogenase small subunit